MVDAPEPPAGDATDRAHGSEPPAGRSRARRLDRRTVAICVAVAVVAAIVAGLVASIALGGSDEPQAKGGIELASPSEINADRLLSVAVKTTAGKTTTLGALRTDRPMLVNFWQSACLSCIDEMPLLERARAANRGVTFVGIASQDRLSKAKALAAQTGITYPWLTDETGNLFYEAKGAGMPTTLLLDAKGTVVATKTGSFKSMADLQAFIDDHVG